MRKGTYDSSPIVNLVSVIPVVCARARNTSSCVGMYPGAEIRSASAKKLDKDHRHYTSFPSNSVHEEGWKHESRKRGTYYDALSIR